MIMGQVEALEAGSLCEMRISERARDSLVLYQSLLEDYAGILMPVIDNVDLEDSLRVIREEFTLNFDSGFFLQDGDFL